jgi:DNA-binding MarR family transcriptional regulator
MADRAALQTQLLDELATFSPTGAMHRMRRWPAGRISLVHLNVLTVLDTEGPVPMRALAELLDVSQASATGIVDRMEQRGLVERRRDDADRRVVRVVLAEPGRQLIEGVDNDRRTHMIAMLDELTDEELAGFLLGYRGMRRARERFLAQHAPADATATPEPRPTQEAPR